MKSQTELARTYLLSISVATGRIQLEPLSREKKTLTYTTSQSRRGGIVASFHTASQASARSKPVMPFRTASAMSESAWVPTYEVSGTAKDKLSPKKADHDIRFNNVLPHWQPTALTGEG